ncbi:MAG: zf-HC2 domain-containing protein, partial [Oscillospiraceae bacterium]
MSKLNCDVIADLMPSYVDDICCDETKTLVDEHLAECEKCTEKITIMKNTIIVADTANQNEFNYMKKIEKCFNKKNAMYFAMLLFVIVVCAFVFFNKLGSVPLSMYYIILPVLLLGTYFFSANTTGKKSISKFTLAVGILCFVLIFYTIFLEFSISNWMKTGVYPFNL